MKKRKVNALLAIGLFLTMMVGMQDVEKSGSLQLKLIRIHLYRKCSFH